jgi:hypothetical protein
MSAVPPAGNGSIIFMALPDCAQAGSPTMTIEKPVGEMKAIQTNELPQKVHFAPPLKPQYRTNADMRVISKQRVNSLWSDSLQTLGLHHCGGLGGE